MPASANDWSAETGFSGRKSSTSSSLPLGAVGGVGAAEAATASGVGVAAAAAFVADAFAAEAVAAEAVAGASPALTEQEAEKCLAAAASRMRGSLPALRAAGREKRSRLAVAGLKVPRLCSWCCCCRCPRLEQDVLMAAWGMTARRRQHLSAAAEDAAVLSLALNMAEEETTVLCRTLDNLALKSNSNFFACFVFHARGKCLL